jgi:type I restriction enzyme S subunit
MTSELNTIPLGDLVAAGESITYGVVKPGDNPPDGVRFVRGGDIKAGRVDMSGLRRISPEVSQQYKRTLLRGGELLVSLVGNPGEVAIAPPDLAGANIARQVGLVRLAPSNSAEFIKYYLMSRSGKLALGAQSLGSVQSVINLSDLKRVPVPQLPLSKQQAVAAILSGLDHKIELHRRMNETLEAMAQAIFRDWFVDFGPVRRKLAGETDPVAIMGGLNPDPSRAAELAALFPAGMGSADVPENWSVEPFGRFFKLERGLSYKGSGLSAVGKPLINLGCFSGAGGFNADKLKFYVGDHKPRHTAEPGTLLIANTDITQDRVILGSPHIVDEACYGEQPLFSHHVYAARPLLRKAWERFFFYHLLEPAFRERAAGFATGTTVLALPKDAIQVAEFAVPPEAVLDSFLDIVRPLLDRAQSASAENRTLAETRDYLLPRLMSGAVRVGDAPQVSA